MKHYYKYIHPKTKTFHGVIIKGRSYWINKSGSQKKEMIFEEILAFKLYRDKIRGKEVKKMMDKYRKEGKLKDSGDNYVKRKRKKRRKRRK